jgi:hypothetical protein
MKVEKHNEVILILKKLIINIKEEEEKQKFDF